MISRRALFGPIFGSSPHPGLIKKANAAHFGQKSPGERTGQGAEDDRISREQNSPDSPDIEPHHGDRRRRRISIGAEQEVPRVIMTKHGVTHCCFELGLHSFHRCSFRLHPPATLTCSDSDTITMGCFLSSIFLLPSLSRLLWTQKGQSTWASMTKYVLFRTNPRAN